MVKIDKTAESEADTVHKIENLKEFYSDCPEDYMSAKQLIAWFYGKDDGCECLQRTL